MRLKPTRAELRGTLLSLLGIAITILFIMAGRSLWKREYSLGILFSAVGGALALAFFRKWKVDLIIIGLIWVMINAGITAVARPSAAGVFITLGSAVGIALLGRWKASHSERSSGESCSEHESIH